MMRIRVLSDLHLEFHPDHGAEFVRNLDADCDVLVPAGDILTGAQRGLTWTVYV